MKIAVTGYKGRLGSALVEWGVIPLDCDITKPISICDAVFAVNPEIVIHCAGATDVDWCEVHRDEAFKINAHGTNNLLNCVGQMYPRPKVIFLSTDYVFDGKRGSYSEKSVPDPKGHYGLTKYIGESLLDPRDTIVRTTILYGSDKKPDFVTRVLDQYDFGKSFKLPRNLYGNPTYVPHLAEAILKLCEIKDHPHIVNISGKDRLSRYEFGYMIGKVFEKDLSLLGYSTLQKTIRPLKAGFKLDLAEKLGLPLYRAHDGLEAMKESMK